MSRRSADTIRIRGLETRRDFEACVALQRRIWGEDFDECVPPAVLQIAAGYGGVVAGAWSSTPEDEWGTGGAGEALVGFVFGLTGIRDQRLVHWSDMLAVAPEWRGRGLAVALKGFQRDRLRALGVEEMRWSFDPLEAGNARLNLSRLGAVGRWYVEDMYGASRSPLHAGIGTDRLVVSWDLRQGEGSTPGEEAAGVDTVSAEEPGIGPGAASASGAASGPVTRVPIPRNLQALKAENPDEARRWRLRVRELVAPVLAAGGEVRGFEDPGPPHSPALILVGAPVPPHPPCRALETHPGERP